MVHNSNNYTYWGESKPIYIWGPHPHWRQPATPPGLQGHQVPLLLTTGQPHPAMAAQPRHQKKQLILRYRGCFRHNVT